MTVLTSTSGVAGQVPRTTLSSKIFLSVYMCGRRDIKGFIN